MNNYEFALPTQTISVRQERQASIFKKSPVLPEVPQKDDAKEDASDETTDVRDVRDLEFRRVIDMISRWDKFGNGGCGEELNEVIVRTNKPY